MLITVKHKDQWRKFAQGFAINKDPDDVCVVLVKYSYPAELENQVVTGADITVDSSSVAGNVVTMQLSGGEPNTLAKVVVKVDSTATAEVIERTFYVRVQEL